MESKERNDIISPKIPDSITFGKKILKTPTLDEMGIPVSGLGYVRLEKHIKDNFNNSSAWINRGDKLVTYTFDAFSTDKPSFFKKLRGDHPEICQSWDIVSPVSGLVVDITQEETVSNGAVGLRYEWSNIRALPVILVPNDEPIPDHGSFYEYDDLTSWLVYYFYRLPIRDRSETRPGRLKDWISKNESSMKTYSEIFEKLDSRDSSEYQEYQIRELNAEDRRIIDNIQRLRTKDINLRDKLVHISREFGQSI